MGPPHKVYVPPYYCFVPLYLSPRYGGTSPPPYHQGLGKTQNTYYMDFYVAKHLQPRKMSAHGSTKKFDNASDAIFLGFYAWVKCFR